LRAKRRRDGIEGRGGDGDRGERDADAAAGESSARPGAGRGGNGDCRMEEDRVWAAELTVETECVFMCVGSGRVG